MDQKQNEYNGAVVCFQKHAPLPGGKEFPKSPACLGYFNRVDVELVRDFFDNIKVTSEHEAGIPCSRKQLVLRRIKDLKNQEEVRLLNSEDTGDGLPFAGNDGKDYALCSFSVFSVSEDGLMSHKPKSAQKRGNDEARSQVGYYTGLAKELYALLKDLRPEYEFQISFMELLGAEDLCLIVLSNQCEALSAVISRLQEYNCGETEGDSLYAGCRVDNVHSILMLDRLRTAAMSRADWGSIKAEVHFSLHSVSGMGYLRYLEPKLKEYVEDHSDWREADSVLLESCSGEFDAILRCPGWLLPVLLGKPGEDPIQGCLHLDNAEFRRKIYQTDTYLHPFGLNKKISCDCENAKVPEPVDPEPMRIFVKNAMEQLVEVFKGKSMRKDFRYLKLPVWRLLKEYWSFASFPMSEDLRDDLENQFRVAINAIVREAKLCKEAEESKARMRREVVGRPEDEAARVPAKAINDQSKSYFLEKYDAIVRALDASMQTGSQQDRWYFGEQRSYLNNVDSYYKILRCYYGILKKMIDLIYHIPREESQAQHYLIPLLSFGVNPLIKSNEYDSFIDRSMDSSLAEGETRPAKLICISLPYQALSNPLKYLGILAHEIFHYSKPADRRNRNELMLKGLLRVAISEFIDLLAICADGTQDQSFWEKAYGEDEAFRTIINEVVHDTYGNILVSGRNKKADKDAFIRLKDIGAIVTQNELRFSTDTHKKGYNFHYQIWCNLRNILWEKLNLPVQQQKPVFAALPDLKAEYKPLYRKMFKLDQPRLHPAVDDEQRSARNQLYWDFIKRVSRDQTIRARNLLKTTYLAMVECPPDIFDLEVVVAGAGDGSGANAEEKIRQFLWQRFNIKRDMLATANSSVVAEGEPLLMKNNIRIAMVISCYLRQRGGATVPERAMDDPRELEAVLADWGGPNNPEFGEAKREFVEDYRRVFSRFRHLFDENNQICEQIALRIRGLRRNPETAGIIEDITAVYEKYHSTLSKYQHDDRKKGEWEKDRCDELFWQICDLIDAYQYQKPYVVEGKTSGEWRRQGRELKKRPSVWERVSFDCNEIAYSAEDLLYKLSRAYERMMVSGRMPQLWYRGQKQTKWPTLPIIMRLERFKTPELDSEGFVDAMAYQMQLAQAHILPDGERLSRSEWPAFLQHYGFKTNALDFSESLSPALFFATEEWADKDGSLPGDDAVVMVFNPVLYNMVMDLLEPEKMLTDIRKAIVLLGCTGLKRAEAGAVLEKACEAARKDLQDAVASGAPMDRVKAAGAEYSACYAAVMALKQVEGDDVWQALNNRAAELAQKIEKAQRNLRAYYRTGISYQHPPLFSVTTEREDDPYRYLYDLTQTPYHDRRYPRAVMVPWHCDRMDKQSGEFVYFNLSAAKDIVIKGEDGGRIYCECNYDVWSLERLHEAYVARIREDLKLESEKRLIMTDSKKFIPFLCRITINRFRYRGFKRYVCAMGMHSFSVYPEYDKLAKDLADELELK